MRIQCPLCGETCESDEVPDVGQHVLCPYCNGKFSYSPALGRQNVKQNKGAESQSKLPTIIIAVIAGLVVTSGLIVATLPSKLSASDPQEAAQKGMALVLAIATCDSEREGAGLPSVWPRSGVDLFDDEDDIAGMKFNTALAWVFNLFDMQRFGRSDWNPYLSHDVTPEVFNLSGIKGRNDWLVCKGVSDDMDDRLPVLVSANVDPSTLLRSGSTECSSVIIPIGSKANRNARMTWSDEYAVVVHKSGSADVIQANRFCLRRIYGSSFSFPPGKKVSYLENDPEDRCEELRRWIKGKMTKNDIDKYRRELDKRDEARIMESKEAFIKAMQEKQKSAFVEFNEITTEILNCQLKK